MILRKEMDGITGEKAQYLVRPFNDNTIRFVLNYPGQVDAQVLKGAVEAVVYGVDVLHGSFHVEKGRCLWRIYEEIEESAWFRQVLTKEDAWQMGYELALEPVKPEDPVKLRCTLVQDGTKSGVVICISHLCADGGDGKYLLGKIVEGYNRILREGSAEKLTIKNGSRDPAQVYAHLSRKERRGLWRNPMPGTKNEYPFADQQPGRARILRTVIDRDTMSAAREKGRQIGATANDLILAACYQAYAAVPGVDAAAPISVAAMMDLRKHCPGGDSEGLTNLAGALKTLMKNGVTGAYEDTLGKIVEQTAQAKTIPLSGLEGLPMMHWAVKKIPMRTLVRLAPVIYGNMSIGMTNLGNLSCKTLALGEQIPVGGMLGGPVKKKPGVQVSVISFDGECELSVLGEYTDEDVTGIQRMLDQIGNEIKGYARG